MLPGCIHRRHGHISCPGLVARLLALSHARAVLGGPRLCHALSTATFCSPVQIGAGERMGSGLCCFTKGRERD